jgi:hypothetical protein
MASHHFANAVLLVVATCLIHGAGMLVIFSVLFRSRMFAMRHFGAVHNAVFLTLVVVSLLVVHLTETASWAALYFYKGCFGDFDTSLYFSMITYTTVGYGDVVLHDKGWRLFAGVEAMTGSLMLCWSTVILVHVVNKMYRQRIELWRKEELVASGRKRNLKRGQ